MVKKQGGWVGIIATLLSAIWKSVRKDVPKETQETGDKVDEIILE